MVTSALSENAGMLANLRKIGGFISAGLCTVFAAFTIWLALTGPAGGQMYAVMSSLCMMTTWAFIFWMPQAQVTRFICAISGVVQISLIVALHNGQPFQIDYHMYYFAWLAVLVLLVDWRAILVGAVVTAVHHVGFNFMLPLLAFPGGADFGRVVLHAVAVVIQTAALVWFSFTLEHMLRALSDFSQTFARAASDLDLRANLNADSRTEMGKLGAAANLLISRLHSAMTEVQKTSTCLEDAATQLNTTSDGITRRSNEQVVTTDFLFEKINESSRQIMEVSGVAREANERATMLKTSATHIEDVMRRLQANSDEIGQISSLISAFSEQTNLLALNASIEAARAGDAGKGFAVVANEVRTLSQNVSQSAIDISSKVKALRENIGEAIQGMDVISESASTMQTINTQVNATVEHQAVATEEISSKITDFRRQLTEVVSELGRNHGAIASVAAESQKLSAQTAVFKL